VRSFAKAWPFFLTAAVAGGAPLLRYVGPTLDVLSLVEMAAILVGTPVAMICGPLILGAMRGWDWSAAVGFYIVFHATYYLSYLLAPSTDQLLGVAQLGAGAAMAVLSLGIGASGRELSQGRRLLSRGPLMDASPYLAGIGAWAAISWVWALGKQVCDVAAPGPLCGALGYSRDFGWLDGLFLLLTQPTLAFLAMMLLAIRRGGDLLTAALCLIVAIALPTAYYSSYTQAIDWMFGTWLYSTIPAAGGFAIGLLLHRSLLKRHPA